MKASYGQDKLNLIVQKTEVVSLILKGYSDFLRTPLQRDNLKKNYIRKYGRTVLKKYSYQIVKTLG